MNKKHPIHSHNPDVVCRWLCMFNGMLTEADNIEIAKALKELPFQGSPIKLPTINMIERVK